MGDEQRRRVVGRPPAAWLLCFPSCALPALDLGTIGAGRRKRTRDLGLVVRRFTNTNRNPSGCCSLSHRGACCGTRACAKAMTSRALVPPPKRLPPTWRPLWGALLRRERSPHVWNASTAKSELAFPSAASRGLQVRQTDEARVRPLVMRFQADPTCRVMSGKTSRLASSSFDKTKQSRAFIGAGPKGRPPSPSIEASQVRFRTRLG